MNNKKIITFLVLGIAILSALTSILGINSNVGRGEYEFQSINGDAVEIYGKGIYQNMSYERAIGAIYQDYVTLILGIPFLLVSLYFARKESLRGRLMLAGTLVYFLTINLFNITNTSYSNLFLVYVLLNSFSFFGLLLTLLSFNIEKLGNNFSNKIPYKFVGGYLIFGAFGTAFSWLSLIVPSLQTGNPPLGLDHYTTMVIQGFDLSIYLPISFLSGLLFFKRKKYGYLMAPVYLIFLIILMTSVSAMLVGSKNAGVDVNGQQLFIFPVFTLITLICSFLVYRNIKENRN